MGYNMVGAEYVIISVKIKLQQSFEKSILFSEYSEIVFFTILIHVHSFLSIFSQNPRP